MNKGARELALMVLTDPGDTTITALARAVLDLHDRLEALENPHATTIGAVEVEERLGLRS